VAQSCARHQPRGLPRERQCEWRKVCDACSRHSSSRRSAESGRRRDPASENGDMSQSGGTRPAPSRMQRHTGASARCVAHRSLSLAGSPSPCTGSPPRRPSPCAAPCRSRRRSRWPAARRNGWRRGGGRSAGRRRLRKREREALCQAGRGGERRREKRACGGGEASRAAAGAGHAVHEERGEQARGEQAREASARGHASSGLGVTSWAAYGLQSARHFLPLIFFRRANAPVARL